MWFVYVFDKKHNEVLTSPEKLYIIDILRSKASCAAELSSASGAGSASEMRYS